MLGLHTECDFDGHLRLAAMVQLRNNDGGLPAPPFLLWVDGKGSLLLPGGDSFAKQSLADGMLLLWQEP